MSEYTVVKKSRLVLKGEKVGSKKKKKSKNKDKVKSSEPVKDEDRIIHSGWGKIHNVRDITGAVAIEIGVRTYVTALDNGLFTLGPPHDEGDGPSPEEILTGVAVSDTKVAFKSGYGKYLGVSKDGTVTGRADAIGPLEQWEPVFQDGKMALLSNSGFFLSVNDDDDSIVADKRTAGQNEMLWVRTQTFKQNDQIPQMPDEERGSISQIEVNYVKKFQKFQDKKLRVNTDDRSTLKRARDHGILHEALLDRRSKMKADRYCK